MRHLVRFFIVSAVLVIFITVGAFTSKQAWSQVDVEKLYADLAKLPAAERSKRIIAGAKKEGTLAFVEALRGKLGRGHTSLFTKRYPWLKAERSELGAQDAAGRLIAEETAGRHLTDVIGTTVLDIAEILQKGVAAKYPTPATDKVLKKYKNFLDPQNRFTTWMWSEHGIVYNTNLLSPQEAPKSWEDLCNPKYKGQISFDPAETRLLVSLYFMMGEEKFAKWVECIGKNKPIVQRGHTVRLQLMLAGDHALSADQYFYNGMLRKSKRPETPFGVVYSAPVIAYGASTVINKNTPHPYAAALYTDWCLSDESQKYLASQYRSPLTMKHPYMPDDVNLFILATPPDLELVNRLHELWNQHVGVKR